MGTDEPVVMCSAGDHEDEVAEYEVLIFDGSGADGVWAPYCAECAEDLRKGGDQVRFLAPKITSMTNEDIGPCDLCGLVMSEHVIWRGPPDAEFLAAHRPGRFSQSPVTFPVNVYCPRHAAPIVALPQLTAQEARVAYRCFDTILSNNEFKLPSEEASIVNSLRTAFGEATSTYFADTVPVYETKTGKRLTDDEIQALADEAEAGYEVTGARRRPVRPRRPNVEAILERANNRTPGGVDPSDVVVLCSYIAALEQRGA